MPLEQDSAAKPGSVGADGQAMTRFGFVTKLGFKCDLLDLDFKELTFMMFFLKKIKHLKYLKQICQKSRFLASTERSECSHSHMVTNH